MSDPFARLIPDARQFLEELSANNTRDWFQSNKARYARDLKSPAEALLEQLRAPLSQLSGQAVSPKLFRAHRDVRFSKDKTPYHTHLHMLWAEPDGPGWFFGISPEYVTAGAGIMALAKDTLTRYRAAIDGPSGDVLAASLTGTDARMDSPELKRVPAPFDKDHRHAELLRRKSIVVWRDGLEVPGDAGIEARLMSVFEDLAPVVAWLRSELKGP